MFCYFYMVLSCCKIDESSKIRYKNLRREWIEKHISMQLKVKEKRKENGPSFPKNQI